MIREFPNILFDIWTRDKNLESKDPINVIFKNIDKSNDVYNVLKNNGWKPLESRFDKKLRGDQYIINFEELPISSTNNLVDQIKENFELYFGAHKVRNRLHIRFWECLDRNIILAGVHHEHLTLGYGHKTTDFEFPEIFIAKIFTLDSNNWNVYYSNQCLWNFIPGRINAFHDGFATVIEKIN